VSFLTGSTPEREGTDDEQGHCRGRRGIRHRAAGAAQAQGPPGQASTPGAAGVDDPYFPNEGNGGYDVRNYDLTLGYDPATDHLDGSR